MDSNFSRIFNGIPRYRPESPLMAKSFFFSTNEHHFEHTLASLKTLPKRGNTVIGVSGLFSLDLLSARMSAPRPSKRAIKNFIVVDKNSVVKTFWRSISRIIAGKRDEKAPSRKEVLVQRIHLPDGSLISSA